MTVTASMPRPEYTTQVGGTQGFACNSFGVGRREESQPPPSALIN
jgi:hypothetical protein